jgi:hypothetical protein
MSSISLERNHPIQVSSHLRPADVGGIRVLGSVRVIRFDEIRYKIFVKQRFTIGRNQDCDIRIKDPTVSSEHCAISRLASGGFLLQDSAAKNGVYVHHPLDGGRTWRRVATIHLTVGLHLLLGDVRLVITDRRGNCPLSAGRFSEFFRQALYCYGTPHAAARATGAPRRMLARIAKAMRERQMAREIPGELPGEVQR